MLKEVSITLVILNQRGFQCVSLILFILLLEALVHAKMANCMPELRTVPLQLEEDSTAYYIPSCTRVERCGGCCVHPLLSCQPTDLEILQVQVMVTEYRGNDKRGGKKLKLRKQKIVEVEQHLSCKCGCKIQPEVSTEVLGK